MPKRLTLPALLVSIALAVVATACGNTSTTKTEKVEGVEWNVTVNKVVELKDTTTGISTYQDFTVADTATVNALMKEIKHCGNITIDWTLPSDDGSIEIGAYENEPLLSEKVSITEATSIAVYDDDIQVIFKFADADKWATITRENIGKRLAVIVNGQLMNVLQANNEVPSGYCFVIIPGDMIKQYLPGIDLERIKQ